MRRLLPVLILCFLVSCAQKKEDIKPPETAVVEQQELLDLEEDIVLISVVGVGLLNRKGVAARIFSSISRAGVNVEMISTGASEAASYFIVRDSDGKKAIKALHHEFFETRNCRE